MNDWFETLDGLWRMAWQSLVEGVGDAGHPAGLPSFATVSETGWPEARSVVSRRAEEALRSIDVYTDIQSDKIASLRKAPRAALHVWLPEKRLQLRMQATITLLQGAQVADLWEDLPDHSRLSYGVSPPPGTPIEDALEYDKKPDQSSFVTLRCDVERMDLVHLGKQHRRARFTKARDFEGEWLVP